MKCINCKYWEPVKEIKIYKSDYHKYENSDIIKFVIEDMRHIKYESCVYVEIYDNIIGNCVNENIIYSCTGGDILEEVSIAFNNKKCFIYSDNEGYAAYHYTAAEFGCINFEVGTNEY